MALGKGLAVNDKRIVARAITELGQIAIPGVGGIKGIFSWECCISPLRFLVYDEMVDFSYPS